MTAAKVADPVTAYAKAVVARKVIAGPYVRAACQRHLDDIAAWKRGERGLVWNLKEAQRVIDLIGAMPLPDGSPFVVQPSQAFIAGSVFGWYLREGPEGSVRRFRTAFVEEGKGNGKTAFTGRLGIVLVAADGQHAAEVYTAGVTRDQAHYLWNDALRVVEASQTLRGVFEIQAHNLAVPATDSYMRPVSSEARSLDQKRVHAALIDEIHEHATSLVVEKMRAGTKGDERALIFEITNSGYDRYSICWQHHTYSISVVTGVIENDSWFAFVCGLDGPHEETFQLSIAARRMVDLCTCQEESTNESQALRKGGARNILAGRSIAAASVEVATTRGSEASTLSTRESSTRPPRDGQSVVTSISSNINAPGTPSTLGTGPSRLGSDDLSSSGSLQWGSVAQSAAERGFSVSTTTMRRGSTEERSAGGATGASVSLETLRKLYSEHSTTCDVRTTTRLTPEGLVATVPGDDWRDEKVWPKANPLLDVTISRRYLREQVQEAKDMPTHAALVQRLNFCVWTEASVGAIEMTRWDACADPPHIETGSEVYAAMDLSTTTDLSALLLIREAEDGYLDVVPYFWCPKETITMRSRRDHVPYVLWVEQGYIIATEGNVVDYDSIRRKMSGYYVEDGTVKHDDDCLADQFHIREFAYDRWNASQLVTDLMSDGATMVPVGQGYASLSAPTKDWLGRIASGKMRHGGNPVLRWMAANLVTTQDPAGNIKPDKAKSMDRIDGQAAAITALSRLIAPHDPVAGTPGFTSYWEQEYERRLAASKGEK